MKIPRGSPGDPPQTPRAKWDKLGPRLWRVHAREVNVRREYAQGVRPLRRSSLPAEVGLTLFSHPQNT